MENNINKLLKLNKNKDSYLDYDIYSKTFYLIYIDKDTESQEGEEYTYEELKNLDFIKFPKQNRTSKTHLGTKIAQAKYFKKGLLTTAGIEGKKRKALAKRLKYQAKKQVK